MSLELIESHPGPDSRTCRVTWVRTVLAGAVLGGTTLVAMKRAEAADLIVNGNFIAEDFQTAAGWQSMDDK
jgi:hypothetical protein